MLTYWARAYLCGMVLNAHVGVWAFQVDVEGWMLDVKYAEDNFDCAVRVKLY